MCTGYTCRNFSVDGVQQDISRIFGMPGGFDFFVAPNERVTVGTETIIGTNHSVSELPTAD